MSLTDARRRTRQALYRWILLWGFVAVWLALAAWIRP